MVLAFLLLLSGCGSLSRGKTVELPFGEGLSVEKTWGYFSGKDGERHSFFLCEDCYDRITAAFAVPVKIREVTELL